VGALHLQRDQAGLDQPRVRERAARDPRREVLGIRSKDYKACDLSDDVQIDLNDRDITRAKQIMNYPWFKDRQQWQREIKKMLDNGFKMEVESLITKDISYVTEVYVPERLKAQDWLT
jgi:DNA topoisomerase-6 subunit A